MSRFFLTFPHRWSILSNKDIQLFEVAVLPISRKSVDADNAADTYCIREGRPVVKAA